MRREGNQSYHGSESVLQGLCWPPFPLYLPGCFSGPALLTLHTPTIKKPSVGPTGVLWGKEQLLEFHTQHLAVPSPESPLSSTSTCDLQTQNPGDESCEVGCSQAGGHSSLLTLLSTVPGSFQCRKNLDFKVTWVVLKDASPGPSENLLWHS